MTTKVYVRGKSAAIQCATLIVSGIFAMNTDVSTAGERHATTRNIHELTTLREVRAGEVFFLKANVSAGEHGIYATDTGCSWHCQYMWSVSIPEEVYNRADIRDLLKDINRTRVGGAKFLEVSANFTLNFVQVPSVNTNKLYRIGSLNLIKIVSRKWTGEKRPQRSGQPD